VGALVQLAHSNLEVQPGRTAQTALTVRNTGSVVDRFTFEAVGDAAEWVTFAPDNLSLFPEASGTVNIMISPPRLPSVLAGPMPFGIKVVSSEDPSGSIVEEGTLQVAPFSDVSTELMPRISSCRRTTTARLAVDNRSNCPYRAELQASDPAAALMLAFNPAVLEVPPGGVGFVKIRIRPRHVFWRGPSTSKPFRITLKTEPVGMPVSSTASADTGPVPTVSAAGPTATVPVPTAVVTTEPHPPEINTEGSLMQSALLPRWLLALAAAIVALAAIAVILWFTLLKPTIRSTAKDQVKSQLAAAGISPTGSGASTTGSGAGGGGSSGGGGSGGGSGSSGGSATTVAPLTVSSSGQTINGSSQANGNSTQTMFTVPSGFTLDVTDLLVQNAAGDTGTLGVAKDGTVLMQWSMANFRDLDYHWIAPTVFGPGTHLQMIVSGCTTACHPGVYFAGNLVKSS
jgi:hypothetical protein